VALFAKRTEDEKLLASARGDLAAAQKKLATVLSREEAAAASEDRWAQWVAERGTAEAEVHRLTKLVAGRESAVQEAARAAKEAEARREIDTCRAANLAIADRIRGDGARLVGDLLALARDGAAAADEANRLNAQLPAGVDPIAIGDFAARDLPQLPREVLKAEEQKLWVNIATGEPVGDQDGVVETGDGNGIVEISHSLRIKCVKRRFVVTTFHPVTTSDHPNYFFALLRLPFVDRPGLAFDGSQVLVDDVAKMSAELPPLPKVSRQVRLELKPVDAWPPAGVVTEAESGVVA
jgi:hypothetical protein